MSSIEEARNIRAEFQQVIVGKGFTEPQAERLTGIEVLGDRLRFPNELLPYGIIDPGRMHNEEFNALLRDFPDLVHEYQAYLRGLSTKFKTTSTFTKVVPINDEEISKVIDFMFQKSPGKYEIR
ncbi:MAG: hypothetical protein AAB800_02995 [Patescibacteria group bacterium]